MKGYTDRYCPRHGWVSVTVDVVKCPVNGCNLFFIREKPRERPQ